MTLSKKYHLKEQKIPRGFHIWLGERGIEVVGIQFKRDAATNFINQPDNWLEFEAEPSNRYDKYAIKILGCYREDEKIIKPHIGYVPAGISKKISLFSVQECIPRLYKTYIGINGYVEVSFQVLAPKGSNKKENIFDSLSSDARILVQEKPKSWEYRLFFQVWIDEVNLMQEKIKYYNDSSNDDLVEFSCNDFINWGKDQLNTIGNYIKQANRLINIEANKAFGPPGIAGNDKSIILVAKDMAKILEKLLDWSMHIRSLNADDRFFRVLNEMSKFPENAITTLIEFPHSALDRIENAIAVAAPDNRQQVDLTIDFTISNYEEFELAFESVNKYYGV